MARGRGRRARTRRDRVTLWLAWWAPLTALWALLVFKTEPAELVAGALAAALAATGAELVRHHGSVSFVVPRAVPARALAGLPRAVVVETGMLLGVVWRVLAGREDVRGTFRCLVVAGAAGRGPVPATRRTTITWVGSVSPNTFVLGFDDDESVVLVHQLRRTAEPPDVGLGP